MKKVALLLVIIFSLVQIVPAIKSFLSSTTTIFIVDEEKECEKVSVEKKNKETDSNFLSTSYFA